jgi:hypothetical protein
MTHQRVMIESERRYESELGRIGGAMCDAELCYSCLAWSGHLASSRRRSREESPLAASAVFFLHFENISLKFYLWERQNPSLTAKCAGQERPALKTASEIDPSKCITCIEPHESPAYHGQYRATNSEISSNSFYICSYFLLSGDFLSQISRLH